MVRSSGRDVIDRNRIDRPLLLGADLLPPPRDRGVGGPGRDFRRRGDVVVVVCTAAGSVQIHHGRHVVVVVDGAALLPPRRTRGVAEPGPRFRSTVTA